MLIAQPHWPGVLAYTSRIRLSNLPSLAVCIRVVSRCDLCCDGRSVTPALRDCILPPWLGLLKFKQLAIPAAADGILITKSRHPTIMTEIVPLMDPCPLLPDELCLPQTLTKNKNKK
jgi:hypothetical protein